MRFIMVAFGFLGWAFYEMSGGADFSADDIRTARLEVIEAKEAEKRAAREKNKPAVVVAEAAKVVVDTDPPSSSDVTRVALNLTNVEPTAQAASTQTEQPVPQNVAVITSSADTPAIIPSLIDPADGLISTLTAANLDIRTVSGNRVNVRGGPGTSFGVVGRLVRGDEVRILQDDGNGWVRFEALSGDTTGWMADFLLSNG